MFSSFVRIRERIDEVGKKIKRESDAVPADRMGRGIGPAGALNTITPCAACKLLRRRCAQECPFSPYFSPHEPNKFASVHKVFGASNVSKMLMVNNNNKQLSPKQNPLVSHVHKAQDDYVMVVVVMWYCFFKSILLELEGNENL